MAHEPKHTISFAEFELDPSKRRLERKGQPVALNAKTFDLLVFLVENAGRVVSKDEILSAVWSGQFVEEANLVVQISALRKVLGEQTNAPRFLVTIPGKGYEFVGEVETDEEIVIEDHRVSHILFEQAEEPIGQIFPVSNRLASWSQFFTFPRILALGVVVAIGITAFWIYKGEGMRTVSSTAAPRITTKTFSTAGGVPDLVAISPNGKSLAYIERLKGQNSLWLGEIESGNSVQIAPYTDRLYNFLCFSPDGQTLYFTARDQNHPSSTLMRVSIYGGAVQELILGVNSPVTFSPDGKFLAFLRREPGDRRTSIVTANADTGKGERILLERSGSDSVLGSGISWSPNGQIITFAGLGADGSALFSLNIADGSVNKIGNSVDNRIVNLVWLPDGSGLLVNRNTGNDAGDGQIWYAPYSGGEMQKVTNDTLNYSLFSLSVSSDNKISVLLARTDPQIWIASDGDLQLQRQILVGNRLRTEGQHGLAIASDGKILFTAKSGDSRTIWEMDSNGGSQRQLTAGQKACNDEQINVTADNRFIVFQSNRSGQREIWRANRDGSELKQLTANGGSQPALSPDGNLVVYSSRLDSKTTLWRIAVDGGEPVQLTTDEASWPDVSPDGRFIACAYHTEMPNVFDRIAIIPFDGGAPVKSFQVPAGAVLYNRLRWSPDGKSVIYKDIIQGLWRQLVDEEKPQRLPGLDDFRVIHLASSNAGLIYSGGPRMREIVILENFQ